LVSQSFVHAARFVPRLVFKEGPTEKMPDTLNPLWGFVRTTPKQNPLVEISITGPPAPDQDFPILAYWHYGLGKSVAFTSDARSQPGRPAWDREWAGSDMYSKFWEQAVEWSLRPTETGRMAMMTEYNDGRVKVTVDARDESNRPLTDLVLRGGVTSPLGKVEGERSLQLKFEQKNSGLYEAEFKADEAGSYFINAQAMRTVKVKEKGKEVQKEENFDSVRSGVTIPYSPEFADLESNSALMERLRDMTSGKKLSEAVLAKAADPQDPESTGVRSELAQTVFREGLPQFKNLQPIWFWLLLFTGVGLFFDVAVRRIAVQPAEAVAVAERVWSKLRGRAAAAVATPQFIDRLKSRKAQVSEALEQLRAVKRFDAGERGREASVITDEPETAARTTPVQRPAAQQRLGPESKQEPADYASRLLKAKKRVWQERDEENE
ncbi:MAG TPA: hypothetical protein VGY58_11375, partial [Gemmataceae bacterium]|nr:hypothetical protein [Gemmataceae bacterium]